MPSSPVPRFSELRLVLEPEHGELVRAFVREAALAEAVPASVASLVADDAVEAWQALCTPDAGRERARIELLCSRREVRTRILLPGYSRFSHVVASLAGRIRRDAGVSCHEHGIDGWEVSVHRSLNADAEPSPAADAPATETPVAAPAVAAAARDYVIDLPQKTDAAAIARCFLEVYGHHYVHAEVFSTRRYWDKVERGELIPAVARDGEGEVIGHIALEREPGMQVAERGEAVVRTAHRGHGLLERMTARLREEAPKHDLHGIYAEPLTIHTFSQRNDARAGMPVCAVLLGANPEDVRPKGVPSPTAGQRQSYLRTFRFVAPRIIYAPAPYRETLLKLYASLDVAVAPGASAAAAADSRTSIKVNDRGYGLISFQRIGPNAAIELAQALRDVRALGACSVQLSAPVADPGLPSLTDAARTLGFFFCGLGPSFADGADTFLLQWLSEPLDTGKLQLFTEPAKELVAFIDRDRAAVGQDARST